MYDNLLYFKDIHIIAKVFSFIFGVWSIYLIGNTYLLLFIAVLFFLFFRNRISFTMILLCFGLSYFRYIFLYFMKGWIILSFFSLFVQSIQFFEIRSFLEYFFYRKRQSKIIFSCLYLCSFCKYYVLYFKEYLVLRKSYGRKFDISFLKCLFSQSLEKTKRKIHHVMLTYQYRFYNHLSIRSYVEKNSITVADLKYLSTVMIIFLMIYLYWR